MSKIKLGFALCGSFCTFSKALKQIEKLNEIGYDVYPIFSEFAYKTDTRFYKAADYVASVEEICKRKSISTICDAEPIGPKKMLDILVIAPCTGNTLSKLAWGITDTSVTMAAKAHLRNERPLVIGVSSNDSLSTTGKNIGILLNRKNVYMVPFGQDDSLNKPRSMVCDFEMIPQTVEQALNHRQIQPLIL
ncbi:MAG: dipicolinate synthase subunit B [Clostridia bacterium]|nr:dipicolinate synthase subunit B [Clostridia bacterium]